MEQANGRTSADTHRVKQLSWAIFSVAGIALVALAARAAHALPDQSTAPYRCIGTFWEAGKAISRGQDPYAAYRLTFRFASGAPDLNLNPPCLLPLFQSLSHLSLQAAVVYWSATSVAIFLLTGALIIWELDGQIEPLQIAWLMLAPAVLDTVELGQIYAALFALGAIAWVLLRRRHWTGASVCVGILVALKPNFALWILALWLAGHRRIAGMAAGVALAVSSVPLALYGGTVYRQWIRAFAGDFHYQFTTNPSLIATAERAGLRPVGALSAITLGAAVLLYSALRRPDARVTTALVLPLAVLCSPLAWFDYYLPLAAVMVEQPWKRWTGLAAALLATPTVLILGSMLHPGWLQALASMVYPAAFLLLVLGAVLRNEAVACDHSARSSQPDCTVPI